MWKLFFSLFSCSYVCAPFTTATSISLPTFTHYRPYLLLWWIFMMFCQRNLSQKLESQNAGLRVIEDIKYLCTYFCGYLLEIFCEFLDEYQFKLTCGILGMWIEWFRKASLRIKFNKGVVTSPLSRILDIWLVMLSIFLFLILFEAFYWCFF